MKFFIDTAKFYRMATGRLPFQGASGAQIIAAILKDEPRSADEINPEIPRHLARVIRECLRRTPDAGSRRPEISSASSKPSVVRGAPPGQRHGARLPFFPSQT